MRSAKAVKKLISEKMTDRKKGISVALGECDDDMDRIHIKFDVGDSISITPVWHIIIQNNFRISQIISWWFKGKYTILLIRNKRIK